MLREMVKFTTCVIVILHVAGVFGVDLAAIWRATWKKIKPERMRQIKESGDDECDQEMKKIWG